MLNPAQNCSVNTPGSRKIFDRLRKIMLRRVWLPKPIYTALPFVYLGLGLYASYAALFMKHWSWIVPYFLLLACVCLHAGLLTATLRIRAYQRYLRRATERRRK